MEIIRGVLNIKQHHQGCIATIGNFDGIHKGHQVILEKIRADARQKNVLSMLICFEPQPQEFFDAYQAPARLTRFREKVALLALYGIDLVLCVKFNAQTRLIPAQRFIHTLVHDIHISGLYVGDDFKFGNGREGSFEQLKTAGATHGFGVTNLHTLTFEDLRVSSTRIRACLAQGDFQQAEQMLGHPYSITGKVGFGKQMGRTLNAPTANIQLQRYRAPIEGVFAVEIDGLDKPYQGVANIGVRPTLAETTLKPILEVHIFDFDRDIYRKNVQVIFRKKIREEKKFSGLAALKAAIASDIVVSQAYFSHRGLV